MSWRPTAQKPKGTLRDYHRRRYGNPLFQRSSSGARSPSSSRRNSDGRPVWPFFVATIGIVGFAYVIWGPTFAINKVDIIGATLPATEETVRIAIEDYRDGHAFGIFPHRNIFLFSTSTARDAIGSKVFLDSVDLDKKLPTTLSVTISEKTPKAVLERAGRLFAVDANGFLIRELAEREMSDMHDLPPGMDVISVLGLGAETVDVPTPSTAPIPPPMAPAPNPTTLTTAEEKQSNVLPLILDKIVDGQAQETTDRPGSQAAPASTIAMILEAYGRLPDIIGTTVRWFEKGDDGKSVVVTTGGDWKIFLSTALPFDAQADRLAIVLKEKVKDRGPQLEYVDLRYNEKIYFRMKGGGEATPTP